jgi:hypothetical protein
MFRITENRIPAVIVDGNKSMGYETDRKLYFFRLAVMWLLSFWVFLKKLIFSSKLETTTFWFDGISPLCNRGYLSWLNIGVIYPFLLRQDGAIIY